MIHPPGGDTRFPKSLSLCSLRSFAADHFPVWGHCIRWCIRWDEEGFGFDRAGRDIDVGFEPTVEVSDRQCDAGGVQRGEDMGQYRQRGTRVADACKGALNNKLPNLFGKVK